MHEIYKGATRPQRTVHATISEPRLQRSSQLCFLLIELLRGRAAAPDFVGPLYVFFLCSISNRNVFLSIYIGRKRRRGNAPRGKTQHHQTTPEQAEPWKELRGKGSNGNSLVHTLATPLDARWVTDSPV